MVEQPEMHSLRLLMTGDLTIEKSLSHSTTAGAVNLYKKIETASMNGTRMIMYQLAKAKTEMMQQSLITSIERFPIVSMISLQPPRSLLNLF